MRKRSSTLTFTYNYSIITIRLQNKMNFDKVYFRYCLLYEFQLGHNAAQAHRNLCSVFGDHIPCERTCERLFSKFKSGDFSIENEQHTGRPVELACDELMALVKSNPRMSTREMARELQCSHMTIDRHLAQLGFVQKIGKWIPHRLNDDQKFTRISICSSLLSRRSDPEWIKQIVTGDEKWILYVNHTRKRQWLPKEQAPEPEPKGDLHPKKVMISVFWDYRGIIWYEYLTPDTTITANVYSLQLQKVAEKYHEKRPERKQIFFLHDNARPHVAQHTQNKLEQLGWEVLPHAPYSPDLAPTDYHLFCSLSNYLRERSFDDFDHLKSDIETFFSSRSSDFYAKGILELPERWSKVVDTNGEYLKD